MLDGPRLRRKQWAKRLLWFVGLWLAGVVGLALVGSVLKGVMQLAGMR
nr:DUF2474 family protein [uncultured Caldimonas sp.]